MYRPVDHILLSDILDEIEADQGKCGSEISREFITRLTANFSELRDLFQALYGKQKNASKKFRQLILMMYSCYSQRERELKKLDRQREADALWLLDQKWVGMSLYPEHFSGDLRNFQKRLEYLQELGINLVHLMPVLMTPEHENDGGYAVSNYRKVNPKLGQMSDIRAIAKKFRQNDMLLVLDIVINHTSREHKWARKARSGSKKHQDYFYMYSDREIPDFYEAHMSEVFPLTAPGNFTYEKQIKKWVMTVFRDYQWDLNYRNPQVLLEMQSILLHMANQGADILRLDAPAFIWKEAGTNCQNLPEVHMILRLMKHCVEVVAPGVKFIAEAIVHPSEIVRYFGDSPEVVECDIAYHATLMALIWNSLATTKVDLMYRSLLKMPQKPMGATWINYIRSHDDIGLGFDDDDIYQAGYDAKMHRQFLYNYYTGNFKGSPAVGELFMRNPVNGDARISGTLASLAGLEKALLEKNSQSVDQSINKILLTQAIIMSYGGLPMIFSGDEIGALNDYSYLNDDSRKADNRWMHRPPMDWTSAERRKTPATVENRIFSGLRKLIALRKSNPLLADHNNFTLIKAENQHVLIYLRFSKKKQLLVIINFHSAVQFVNTTVLKTQGFEIKGLIDLYTGKSPKITRGMLELRGYQFCFLQPKATKK